MLGPSALTLQGLVGFMVVTRYGSYPVTDQSTNVADQLTELAALHQSAALTQTEFEAAKVPLLGAGQPYQGAAPSASQARTSFEIGTDQR